MLVDRNKRTYLQTDVRCRFYLDKCGCFRVWMDFTDDRVHVIENNPLNGEVEYLLDVPDWLQLLASYVVARSPQVVDSLKPVGYFPAYPSGLPMSVDNLVVGIRPPEPPHFQVTNEYGFFVLLPAINGTQCLSLGDQASKILMAINKATMVHSPEVGETMYIPVLVPYINGEPALYLMKPDVNVDIPISELYGEFSPVDLGSPEEGIFSEELPSGDRIYWHVTPDEEPVNLSEEKDDDEDEEDEEKEEESNDDDDVGNYDDRD